MKDQVRKLQALSVNCTLLWDDGLSTKAAELQKGAYSFVYSSPEAILRVYRNEFKARYFQEHMCCVAIDEIHGIVKWYVCLT